jgi:group I intron endonuclease
MDFAVYEIRNKANDKRYVGSTIDLERRHGQHIKLLESNSHHSAKLQNAWNKYGANAFTFQLIANLPCKAEMLELEQFLLDEAELTAKGYNINPVANNVGLLPKSEEHKRNIGRARLGKRNTLEARQRMSEAAKRRGPIKRTAESYALAAIKLRGKKRSDEFKERMRQIALNRPKRPPMSLEARQSIAERRIGTKLINGKFVKVS